MNRRVWEIEFQEKARPALDSLARRVKRPPSDRSPAEISRDVHRAEGRTVSRRYVKETLAADAVKSMVGTIADIGWYYHLIQRRPSGFSSTVNALQKTDKRARLAEKEKLARDLARFADRLAPIERDTSLQQQVWRALLRDGHFGTDPACRVKITPFFLTEILRQIARELRDADAATPEIPPADLCLLDMSRAIAYYTGAARMRSPSRNDILLILVRAALGEHTQTTPGAIEKRLQRLKHVETVFRFTPTPQTATPRTVDEMRQFLLSGLPKTQVVVDLTQPQHDLPK